MAARMAFLQRASGVSEFAENRLVRVAPPASALRGDFERLGQQAVAGQDGDAFAEDLVVRQLAPAGIVIVHRRQVVVDERIGVDALDGASEGHRRFEGATARFGCGQAEDRAEPLAAGEERVAHRLVDGGWFGGGTGQEPSERTVHCLAAGTQIAA